MGGRCSLVRRPWVQSSTVLQKILFMALVDGLLFHLIRHILRTFLYNSNWFPFLFHPRELPVSLLCTLVFPCYCHFHNGAKSPNFLTILDKCSPKNLKRYYKTLEENGSYRVQMLFYFTIIPEYHKSFKFLLFDWKEHFFKRLLF